MQQNFENITRTKTGKSDKIGVKNVGRGKKLVRKVGKVARNAVSAASVLGSATVPAVDRDVDATSEVIASKRGKEIINQVLKLLKCKPALTAAAAITCAACVPVAGAVARPGLCIACDILIAKVVG